MPDIEEGFCRKGGIRSKPSTSKPDFIPPPQKNSLEKKEKE